MQAYKAKGKIDATGDLVVEEPIQIPPGNVEVIILQVADDIQNSTETVSESKPILYGIDYKFKFCKFTF